MTPNNLDVDNWLSRFDAVLVTPDISFTCVNGGRILDYAIMSRPLSLAVRLVPQFDSPWPTHIGLTLAIFRRPRHIHANILWVPRAFPHPIPLQGNNKGKGTQSLHDRAASDRAAAQLWSDCVGAEAAPRRKIQRKGAKVLYGGLPAPFADRGQDLIKVSALFLSFYNNMETFHLNNLAIPSKELKNIRVEGSPL